MKNFERYHPISNFTYFLFVVFICMITLNPIIILIALICGMTFYALLKGARAFVKSLLFSLPLILLVTATNPLFSRNGQTLLLEFIGIRVTLEALFYGFIVSCMLSAVFYWFSCYSFIMTADKFMSLFGKIIPKLSLVFCMTLMFIPRFNKQYKKIYAAQKAIGQFSMERRFSKIKNYMSVMSVLFGWALENSIETADSMRARGYGLKGRTSCVIYHIRAKDIVFLVLSAIFFAFILYAEFSGIIQFAYYPTVSDISFSVKEICVYAISFALFSSVIFLHFGEDMKWRILKSKI